MTSSEAASDPAATIRRVWAPGLDWLSDRAVYGLLLCLSDRDLGQVLVQVADDSTLAAAVEKHISRRLSDGEGDFRALFQTLMELAADPTSDKMRLARRVLYHSRDFLEPKNLRQLFSLLIESPKYHDRVRAYNIAPLVWNAAIESALWESWADHGHQACLFRLAENASFNRLASIFPSVWSDEDTKWKSKKAMLVRLAQHDLSLIEDLRTSHPMSYLFAAAKADIELTPAEALELTKSLSDERDLGLAFWCLGKLGQWDSILLLHDRRKDEARR